MDGMQDIPITVYGDVDRRAVEQLERCARAGDAVAGALCADGHVGYSQPIGGVVAYPDHISPSGVGYDIACLVAGTPVTTVDGWHMPIEHIGAGAPIEGWDARRLRVIDPCEGTLARGVRPTRRITLATGRALELTGDHLIRTKLGWRPAAELVPGEAVACAPFVGLPHEVAEMSAALLRLLAYCAGDGNLNPDGRTISWYTNSGEDAADLARDIHEVGCSASVYFREDRKQYDVRCRSRDLHAQVAALGCPVGKKVYAWPERPFGWLFDLPAWQRAVFLSSFMSAEGTTLALASGTGYVAPMCVKQAGVTDAPIRFVEALFASLGFVVHVTPSSGGRQTYVAQLQGGEPEILRYLREVGFNRAVGKRRAAAAMLSAIAQRRDAIERRAEAVEAARELRAVGATVRAAVVGAADRFGVPQSLVHHGLYGRGAPRTAKGWRPEPDHSNEVAWLPVLSNEPTGEVAAVFDLVTGDDAACFLAGGIVVHNCGNKAVRTNVRADAIHRDLPRIMDDIFSRISFGVGRKNDEPVGHPVLDQIKQAEFEPQRQLYDLAAKQLGTVGAGNHYVDLFEDEQGVVWIGVHFGSRGFGHKTASGFLALAEGLRFGERANEGEMDSPPKLLRTDEYLGQAYISAMQLAGEYAYAGRDVVVDKVLEILGAAADYEVHNHHNFAWRETHFGQDVWVVRKGCTPAFPGQEGFVGATMGEPSVILRGTDAPEGDALLRSTVHGAGRVMSRTQAAGKLGTRLECPHCDWWTRPKEGGRCPNHPKATPVKRRGRIKEGLIDYRKVRKQLTDQGIEVRGGAADEAPDAYKRLDQVLAAHGDTIEIVHRLTPIGVAMAGADTFDPYKD